MICLPFEDTQASSLLRKLCPYSFALDTSHRLMNETVAVALQSQLQYNVTVVQNRLGAGSLIV
jgi:hypothetical protein